MRGKSGAFAVNRFIKAVYPEAPDLAIACFDEETCLTDAAQLIEDLRAENEALKGRTK